MPLGCLGGMQRAWSWPRKASDASLSGSLTGCSYRPLAPIRWPPSSCWTEGWRGCQVIHISWTACLGGCGIDVKQHRGEYGALGDTVLETSKPAMLAVNCVESEAAVG